MYYLYLFTDVFYSEHNTLKYNYIICFNITKNKMIITIFIKVTFIPSAVGNKIFVNYYCG